MHKTHNKIVIAAIVACFPLSSAWAEGLGLSVNLGGISAGVNVGGGALASANVGIGKSHGVSAGVSIGGSSGGGDTGGSGSDGGGSGSDGGSGGNQDNRPDTDTAMRDDRSSPALRGAPVMVPAQGLAAGTIIGTTVWTSDNVLVGVITETRPGPDDKLMLSVEIVDGFGISQDVVIFQMTTQAVTDGRLTLNLRRTDLIDRLA